MPCAFLASARKLSMFGSFWNSSTVSFAFSTSWLAS